MSKKKPSSPTGFDRWFSKYVPPSLFGSRPMFELCWRAALQNTIRKPPKRTERTKQKQDPDICCVANDGCKQPAGWRCGGLGGGIAENTGPFRKLANCYVCGETVCTNKNCSKLVRHDGKMKVRICDNCREDHD